MGTLWKLTPVWLRVTLGVALIVGGAMACRAGARPPTEEEQRRFAADPFKRDAAERDRRGTFMCGATLVCVGCALILFSERSRAEKAGYTTIS